MVCRIVIPARYGSSRLPGKPILDLGGKPMVLHVVDVAKIAMPKAKIFVATDDERIFDLISDQVETIMTLKEHESGTDRIAEVVQKKGWSDDDIVINVQGDEPFIPSGLIRGLSEMMMETDSEMGTVVTPLRLDEQLQNPNVVKVICNENNEAVFFSRAPVPFDRDKNQSVLQKKVSLKHVGIYAYKVNALKKITAHKPCDWEIVEKLEQLRALYLGIKIKVILWDQELPQGIDTPKDLEEIRKRLIHK